MSNTTPQELLEAYESATENNNRVRIGRTDAVYHVGKLLTGEWSPEFIGDLQATLADTTSDDYDAVYHYGYLTAWETVSGLANGQPLKTIARLHG